MDQYAELARRLDNMIRSGTIAEVDHAANRCRVATGKITTGWLPMFVRRAGSTRDWDPATVGEQGVVLSPGGDPTQGFVLVGLHSDANQAPASSATLCRRQYPDGATIDYDHASHSLSATLPDGGKASVIATGGLYIEGPIEHVGDYKQTGNQDVTGKVTVSEDVVAAGISLVDHPHGNVQPGSGISGGPLSS